MKTFSLILLPAVIAVSIFSAASADDQATEELVRRNDTNIEAARDRIRELEARVAALEQMVREMKNGAPRVINPPGPDGLRLNDGLADPKPEACQPVAGG